MKEVSEEFLEEKPSNFMAHKVHPKIFRIKNLADWNSRWLDTKKFPQYLEEDFEIRKFLEKKLGKIGIEKIFPLYSPLIEKIEVIKKGKARRAKLYYLRKKK